MRELKGFEVKNNLIVVTGMLGSCTYSLAEDISKKCGIWHLNYDTAIADWLNISTFSSMEERRGIVQMAAKLFFYDWHSKINDNDSVIISGAFAEPWNRLFNCTCKEHDYSLTVVDCIAPSFDDAYESYMSAIKSDKYRILACEANDDVGVVVDKEFGTDVYRSKIQKKYLDNKFNKIEGNFKYNSDEVYMDLLGK